MMPRRNGYTLLEVLLALGIATMLLAGLYVTMDVQLSLADAGRARLDDAAIARALLARISNDVTVALTPIRASAAATGSGGAAASGTPTTGTSATGTTTPSTAPVEDGTTSLTAVMPLNCGVQGEIDRLILFVSRVPGVGHKPMDADGTPNGGPDQRRVTYWKLSDGGLARQEICRVTADDDDSRLPPDVPDEARYLIAPEVQNLEFRFFDGTNWIDMWDGALAGEDGATPVGPPRAVEIKLWIRSAANPDRVNLYRHVVAIQSANAQPIASTTDTEVMP